jgi:hypothetical protein
VKPKDAPNDFGVSEIVEREVRRRLKAVLLVVDKQRVEDQNRFTSRLRKHTFYLACAIIIAMAMAVTALYFGYVL